MKIKDLITVLEAWAPPAYQESYDNSGLIVGDKNTDVTRVLISLDCIESVIDEAIQDGCQLVIAHHPILFGSIKRLTGANYVERTLIKAIQNNIAIYAIHTNLDNVPTGVNDMIADKLNLINRSILSPKSGILKKLVTFIPPSHLQEVTNAIFEAGGGHIGNYSHCGFNVTGEGSFQGNQDTKPFIGTPEKLEKTEEFRFETIFPAYLQSKVTQALLQSHPYEEVAFDIYSLDNTNPNIGAGMIGNLESPISLDEFLKRIKAAFNLQVVKYSNYDKPIHKVALCGGSGSFLRTILPPDVDAFVTGDVKYHEWFDAQGNYSFIDIGHYESEQFTPQLILNYLNKKSLSLHSQISKVNTNPVNYYL